MSEAFAAGYTIPEGPATSVRVGVLSFHTSKEREAICNPDRALGHQPVCLREENTRTWLENGTLQFDPDVDVVANRLLTTTVAQPLDDLGVATSYAAAHPVLNAPETVMRALHKYGAAATPSAAGPIVATTRVKSGARNGRRKRPLVDLEVNLGDRWHSTTASIEDRSHMSDPVLLDRDDLRGDHVDTERRVAEQ